MTEEPKQDAVTGFEIPSGMSPIVVFGTGGSGTRAVAAFLSACGIEMGEKINVSRDALAFTPALRAHADRVIGATHCLDYDAEQISTTLRSAVIADYRRAGELHRQEMPPLARWGFKQPQSIFTLPLIDAAFPYAMFIHVLRDGRDMLLSRNRNQPRRYFEALFGRPFADTEADVARFWAKSNMEAHAFGIRRLKKRYAILRIEDVCGPQQEKELLAFADAIGLDRQVAARWADVFKPQDSFGRGRGRSIGAALVKEFDAALATFRYA